MEGTIMMVSARDGGCVCVSECGEEYVGISLCSSKSLRGLERKEIFKAILELRH